MNSIAIVAPYFGKVYTRILDIERESWPSYRADFISDDEQSAQDSIDIIAIASNRTIDVRYDDAWGESK